MLPLTKIPKTATELQRHETVPGLTDRKQVGTMFYVTHHTLEFWLGPVSEDHAVILAALFDELYIHGCSDGYVPRED